VDRTTNDRHKSKKGFASVHGFAIEGSHRVMCNSASILEHVDDLVSGLLSEKLRVSKGGTYLRYSGVETLAWRENFE
jgi:hypothetical protein